MFDQNNTFFKIKHFKIFKIEISFNVIILVVTQDYETDVPKAYIINGNSALLKCVVPSIVADFVSVEGWNDNNNNEYFSSVNNGNDHLI